MTASVPLSSSRMRTLKLTSSMSARCGWTSPIAARSARSSALTGPLPSAVCTRRSPPIQILIVASVCDLAVGALLDDHPPGLEAEERLVAAGLAPQQQLERAVGRLELVALVLELLDAPDHARRGRVVELDAERRRLLEHARAAGELGDQQLASLPTSAGSMCSKVVASAATPAACMPPLCAKALRPT